MNRENVEKWVAALRSGEYTQGRSYLRRNNEYCCLGVACDLAMKDGIKISIEIASNGASRYDGRVDVIPVKVREWLGIDERDPRLHWSIINRKWSTATVLNDVAQWDFPRIANAIEHRFLQDQQDKSDMSGHVGSSDGAPESS